MRSEDERIRAIRLAAGISSGPQQVIADLIDAPVTPEVSVGNPDCQWMLLMEPVDLVPLTQLAQPELRLAALRLESADERAKPATYTRLALPSGFRAAADGDTGCAEAPHWDVRWSPDGHRFPLPHAVETDIELWVAEARNPGAERPTAIYLTPSSARRSAGSRTAGRSCDIPAAGRRPRRPGAARSDRSGQHRPENPGADLPGFRPNQTS